MELGMEAVGGGAGNFDKVSNKVHDKLGGRHKKSDSSTTGGGRRDSRDQTQRFSPERDGYGFEYDGYGSDGVQRSRNQRRPGIQRRASSVDRRGFETERSSRRPRYSDDREFNDRKRSKRKSGAGNGRKQESQYEGLAGDATTVVTASAAAIGTLYVGKKLLEVLEKNQEKNRDQHHGHHHSSRR